MVDVILAIIWIAILVLYIVVGWKDAQTETGGKQTTLEKETGTENETTAADRRTSVSSEV